MYVRVFYMELYNDEHTVSLLLMRYVNNNSVVEAMYSYNHTNNNANANKLCYWMIITADGLWDTFIKIGISPIR